MRKITIAVVTSLVIVVAGVVAYLAMSGPSATDFAHLEEPRIVLMADEKMLVVEAKGDPNVVGGDAFGLMLQLYYATDDAGYMQAAPRARWPVDLESDKSDWVGQYGMPVSHATTNVPDHDAVEGLTVSLATWSYGEVAEVLHVGPYDQETPTIDRLKAHIAQEGYVISGIHEEEYLKGPGMFLSGNPDDYLTIIRYRVDRR